MEGSYSLGMIRVLLLGSAVVCHGLAVKMTLFAVEWALQWTVTSAAGKDVHVAWPRLDTFAGPASAVGSVLAV